MTFTERSRQPWKLKFVISTVTTKNLEKSYNKRYQASLIENSRFVQEQGLGHFMEQQKIKFACSKCGGIISIHDRECSECQEKMK